MIEAYVLEETIGHKLETVAFDTLQINIGLTCNLECRHCHVVSGPRRTEQMSRETLEAVVAVAKRDRPKLVDITGGAPEMNPNFRWFIEAICDLNIPVQVRTNLTILLQKDYQALTTFYRHHEVTLVASLPCYLEENVEAQRGADVYPEAIAVLKKLNALGYGDHPAIDLVYNPIGPHLPPGQKVLENDYRQYLGEHHGIVFRHLFTITNVNIGQFRADLKRQGHYEDYQRTLEEAYNPETIAGLMCRNQINVAWDGTLYDCDFNFAVKTPALNCHNEVLTIHNFSTETAFPRRICSARHCFACTAGAGSSCGGALVP